MRDAAEFDIFISYREDSDKKRAQPVVPALSKRLRAAGFKVWEYSVETRPGAYELEMLARVRQSRCVVVLIPSDAPPSDMFGPKEFWEDPTPENTDGTGAQRELLTAVLSHFDSWQEFTEAVRPRRIARGSGDAVTPASALELPIVPFLMPPRNVNEPKPPRFSSVHGVPRVVDALGGVMEGYENLEAGISKLIGALERMYDANGWEKLGAIEQEQGDKSPKPGDAKPPRSIELITEWEDALLNDPDLGGIEAMAPEASPRGSHDFESFRRELLRTNAIRLWGEGVTRKFEAGPYGARRAEDADAAATRGGAKPNAMALDSWLFVSGPRCILLMGPRGSGRETFMRRVARVAKRKLLGEPLENTADEVLASNLQRTFEGQQTWPFPLWLEAKTLYANLQQAPGAHMDRVKTALRQMLPAEAQTEFFSRIQKRPYIFLLSGVDQLRPEQRHVLLQAAVLFTSSIAKAPFNLVASVDETSVEEASHSEPALLTILEGESEIEWRVHWEAVKVQCVSLAQVRDFCAAIQAAHGRTAIKRIVARSDQLRRRLKRYEGSLDPDAPHTFPQTVDQLMTAVFLELSGEHAATGESSRTANLVRFMFERPKGKDMQRRRRLIGRIAADCAQARTLEFSTEEVAAAAAAEFEADALDGASEDIDAVTRDASLFVRAQSWRGAMSDGVGAAERYIFNTPALRDALAADYLVLDGEWRERFDRYGVLDSLEREEVWRTILPVAVASLLLSGNTEEARDLFSDALSRLSDSQSDGHVLSSILAQLVDETHDVVEAPKRAEVVERLAAHLGTISPLLPARVREREFSRIVQLKREFAEFPPGVRDVTELALGATKIRVANAPVTARQFAGFLDAIEQDEGDVESYFEHVPLSLAVEEGGADEASPTRFLISNRVPGFWERQRLMSPDRPVVGVNWIEAMAYCRWLTAQCLDGFDGGHQGLSLAPGELITLPTYSEWRGIWDALRGERPFAWGADAPDRGLQARVNWRGAELGSAATVGVFPRYESGVYDFGSNVFEWSRVGDEPRGRERFDHERLVNQLGMSFLETSEKLSHGRDYKSILYANDDLGFRWVVVTVEGLSP